MTLLNKHIADVVFERCDIDNGEPWTKMVIYTGIDPSPISDEGKRVLADFMCELEVHTRQHPEIRRIELIKDR